MAGQALDIQVPPEDILSANDLNALRDEILEKIGQYPDATLKISYLYRTKKSGRWGTAGPWAAASFNLHNDETRKAGRLQAIINVRVGEATLCEIPSDGFEYARAQFTCGEQVIPAVRQVPYQPPAAQPAGQPVAQPGGQPAGQPGGQPGGQPVGQPVIRDGQPVVPQTTKDDLVARLEALGLQSADIGSMTDADFVTCGFNVLEKIKLRSFFRTKKGSTDRALAAGVAGDLDPDEVSADPVTVERRHQLYYAIFADNIDMTTAWRQKLQTAAESVQGNIPRLWVEEREFLLTIVDEQNSKESLQLVLEKLMKLLIKVTCFKYEIAVATFEAKTEKEKRLVRQGLRTQVNYDAIIKDVVSKAPRNFFPSQSPFFRRGRSAGRTGATRNRSSSRPPPPDSTRSPQVCRKCGANFEGEWKEHAKTCEALQH